MIAIELAVAGALLWQIAITVGLAIASAPILVRVSRPLAQGVDRIDSYAKRIGAAGPESWGKRPSISAWGGYETP